MKVKVMSKMISKNIKSKLKLLLILITMILTIGTIILISKENIKKLHGEVEQTTLATQEDDLIDLNIEIKEETTSSYKCLLIFVSNDRNNKIKSIEYPQEAERETYKINVNDKIGKEKIAIDYELMKTDLIKIFKVKTQEDQEIEIKTAYNINFDLNDGSGNVINQTFLTGMEHKINYAPSRTGHNLLGWYTKSSGGEKVSVLLKKTNLENTTLFAHWQIWTHTVHYDSNKGTGAPADQTKIYGQTLKLSNTQPTRLGYNFVNWNTKANGTGISYSPGSNYVAEQNGGTVTLYAQWKSTATANIVGYYAYPANKYSNITYGENYFNFDITCLKGYEKLNIPINGLLVGHNYKLSFTRYYEGTFNPSIYNFGCKMNPSIISQTSSKVKNLSFNSRTTGTVQGSFIFNATSSTMYWVWDLSDLKDGKLGKIRLSNISIEIQ